MRVFLVILAVTFALTGCTRGLTPKEEAFGKSLFGDSLDTSKVKIAAGFGLLPPAKPTPFTTVTLPRDAVNCIQDTKKEPGERGKTAAFVRFQTIHYLNGWYRGDLLDAGDSTGVPIAHALVFAHELVHVWQWQNRQTTGYHPLRGFSESVKDVDPYFYKVSPERAFADYGFEQQARMIEDYLCLRIVDPTHPQAATLKDVLAPVLALIP